MKPIGFGRYDEEVERAGKNYEIYRNNWVSVGDGETVSGMVADICQGDIILMPYHTVTPKGKMLVHTIVREGLPRTVPINERTRIEPTSEKEVLDYCSIINRQIERDLIIKELEFFGKAGGLQLNESYIDGSGI